MKAKTGKKRREKTDGMGIRQKPERPLMVMYRLKFPEIVIPALNQR